MSGDYYEPQAPRLTYLPPLNYNYDPPQAWVCLVGDDHACGPVIGALGALPVCAEGDRIESAVRAADRRRIQAMLAKPEWRAVLAAEAAMERRLEMGR